MIKVSGLKILEDVKNSLGISKEDDSFDSEILMHINGAYILINQVGACKEGLEITNETIWDDILRDEQEEGNKSFSIIKQYIFTKVKVLFDPPQTSATLEVLTNLSDELLWRIRLAYEERSEV